jgi:hypothetical protein
VGSGQLARRQADYERHILARGDLLLGVRRSQAEFAGNAYVNRLLLHAQQYSLLVTPDDAYWKAHFANNARQLDNCIRMAAAGGRSSAAELWDQSTEIYAKRTTYPAWAEALAATEDPESSALLAAERELLALQRLLAIDELQNLERQSRSSLTGLGLQLEHMLLQFYQRLAASLEQDTGPGSTSVAQLQNLASLSACEACKLLLLERAAWLEAEWAEAQAPPPAATQPEPTPPPPAALEVGDVLAPVPAETPSEAPSGPPPERSAPPAEVPAEVPANGA